MIIIDLSITVFYFQHSFVTSHRAPSVIPDLIARTKKVVQELDNFQYKKMRKLMYLDEDRSNHGDLSLYLSLSLSLSLSLFVSHFTFALNLERFIDSHLLGQNTWKERRSVEFWSLYWWYCFRRGGGRGEIGESNWGFVIIDTRERLMSFCMI